VRKVNPAIYVKHKWLSGCAESSALLGLLIHHKIIPASTLVTSHPTNIRKSKPITGIISDSGCYIAVSQQIGI